MFPIRLYRRSLFPAICTVNPLKKRRIFARNEHCQYLPLRFCTQLATNNSKQMEAVNKSSQVVIGTHSGIFHCDEALACFLLRQLPEYANAQIYRSRDVDLLHKKCDIIVDVGGVFDHERKLYDHHQSSFKETFSTLRPEFKDYNIRLSSAGLVYVFYGEHIINDIVIKETGRSLSPADLKLCFEHVYRSFIQEIDAIDNGTSMCPEGQQPHYHISTHLSARLAHLNPTWLDNMKEVDIMARFEEAIKLAGGEFKAKVLRTATIWLKAREVVRTALLTAKEESPVPEIIILKQFCPWKQHLSELEEEYNVVGIPKLVLYPDASVVESWRVNGVPVSPNSFRGRKFLPEPWRGKRDEELSAIAGIEGLTFVHHSGFLGGAKTLEAALEMAVKSNNWSSE